jgi:tetratricopeptide (TPR) repeat protein
MATSSEIEKLERKWKENPRGTVFAPYAEALRKHGELAEAQEVLRQGLEQHPDYVPGNIVLGRCCLDLLEDGAAETAFSNALRLDPENVIALKALADITERQGRLAEAASWLNQLIAVDPSNDEARDQLTRVEKARDAAAEVMHAAIQQQPAAAASEEVETSPLAGATAAPGAGPREVQLVPEVTAPPSVAPTPSLSSAPTVAVLAPSPPEAPPSPPAEEPILLDDLVPRPPDFRAGEGRIESFPLEPARAEPIELRPSASTEYQPQDVVDLLGELRGGSGEFQEADALSELTSLSAHAAGGSEFQTPSGVDDLLASAVQAGEGAALADQATETFEVSPPAAAATGSPPAPSPAVPAASPEEPERSSGELRLIFPDQQASEPPRVRRISEEVAEPAASPPPSPPRAAPEPTEAPISEPEPVLTETMAEVYARQGLVAEALSVLRRLAERNPGDARLRNRIRALESSRQAAPSGRGAYLASASGGESIESFFGTLVRARLPGPGDGAEPVRPEALMSDAPGAPTRPASDPLSLSAIFGEDSPAPGAEAGPPAPARPSQPTPPSDAFSFDQFFGGGSGGAGGMAAGAGNQTHGAGRPGVPNEEDLDQFQNWLKSLKK